MSSIFEGSMCIWKECVFCFFGMKGSLHISIKSISSRALFNATMSLLIFCLEDLSIFDSGMLKSPSIIVLLSIFFLKSSKIFLMSLLNGLSILFIFSKNQLLDSLILRIVLLVSMSFNSALFLFFSFFVLALGCLFCFSLSSCRCRIRLFISTVSIFFLGRPYLYELPSQDCLCCVP